MAPDETSHPTNAMLIITVSQNRLRILRGFMRPRGDRAATCEAH